MAHKMALVILLICVNLIFYGLAIYGIRRLGLFSYDFAYEVFGDVPAEQGEGREVKVTILKGETTMNIASKLEDAKVITDRYSFFVKLKLRDYEIMPGTFILRTSMNYDEVLDVITDYSKSIDAETKVEDVESAP